MQRTSRAVSTTMAGRRRVGSFRKGSRVLVQGVLLLALVSLAATSSPAGASHSWGGYHWARAASEFTLGLGDNVSSTWDPYLLEASSDWSVPSLATATDVLDAVRIPGGAKSAKACKPTKGRVEVCATTYGFNGWLGVASIWVAGSHITQATVKMNDTYFNMASYNTPAWRQSVMCQEIGHAFGLDHQDEEYFNPNLGSCMDYTSDPDGPASNEHPNAHDYDQLKGIYEHSDDTNTVGSTGSSDSTGSGHRPEDWGRTVKKDANGRPSVYERDLGGGRKVFNFVIWAG